jgi:hypothetical protein
MYTRDVMAENMIKFINGEVSLDVLMQEVSAGWSEIHNLEGKLHQLETYRAALGLDAHSEVDLCRLHRDLMDQRDPSICRKYDPSESNSVVLPAVISSSAVIVVILIVFLLLERRHRAALETKKVDDMERDEILEVQKLVYDDNLRVLIVRMVAVCVVVTSGIAMTIWVSRLHSGTNEQYFVEMVSYDAPALHDVLASQI